MKILIVDDDSEVLDILQIILESKGYEVMAAQNGQIALEMAGADPPCMVISDILMPVMDGYQLCMEWKKDSKLKSIPFIFKTASYIDEKDEKFALKLGADKFIRKPIELDEFIRIIQDVIGGVKEGKIKLKEPSVKEDKEILKLYSERLVKKLESTNLDLEKEIIERKLVEEQLRESEERLRSVVETANDAIVSVDAHGNVIFWNHGAESIFNYSVDEIVGQPLTLILPEQFRESHQKGISRVISTETSNYLGKTLEIVGFRKDGSEFPLELSVATWKAGGETFFTGILRDISERKQAEDKLRKSESSLSGAQRIAHLGNWDWDIVNNHLSWSDEIYRIFGLNSQEFAATYEAFLKTVHADDRELVTKAIEEALNENKSYNINHRIVLPDGSERIVHEKADITFDDGGKPIWMFGTLQDITEREDLQAQLRQAQKMEAVGTLAGGVAHDFNNILTTIIGNAQLALMKVGKDDYLREEIEEIRKAGERAAALTRQLLAFSRKQIVQPKILDINEIVTDMEKMLGRLIREDVKLLTIPEPELWRVEADPGQMEQVIMNLVVNASDAMSMGDKLTIETINVDLDENYFREHGIKEEQPGTYVMLAVSDTGSGMDKETQEHIFEPFFTTKDIGKGTGLGLSTVYGIVKQNNGFIWVYSEPGKGTTFKIYLPKVKEGTEPEEKERTPVSDLNGSETVFIVEDNDSLRNLTRKILERYEYSVLEAENGADALRVSEEYEGQIDLMLTDVVMPKISGKETAKLLQPLYPQMKVIYMSGYTDNAIVNCGVLKPGLNFIEKPFSPEDLACKVREVLD